MAFLCSSWSLQKDVIATFFANKWKFSSQQLFLSHKWTTLKIEETLQCRRKRLVRVEEQQACGSVSTLHTPQSNPVRVRGVGDLIGESTCCPWFWRASLIYPKAEQSLSYAPVIYIDFLKFKQILNGRQLLYH